MKKLVTGLLLLTLVMSLLTGCQEKQYAVANYQGQRAEGQAKSDYNKELFYRNDKQTGLADPFVLDNTSVDGYYYMYGTEGSLFCYRSQNLMDWEPVGNALDNYFFNEDGKMNISNTEVKNGVYAEDGAYYYYVDGVRTGAGLVKVDGYYYYASTGGACKTGKYWVSRPNDLMPAGYYFFDEATGKMIR